MTPRTRSVYSCHVMPKLEPTLTENRRCFNEDVLLHAAEPFIAKKCTKEIASTWDVKGETGGYNVTVMLRNTNGSFNELTLYHLFSKLLFTCFL